MTPLEIINKWCDKAHEQGKTVHKALFWVARDILENKLEVPEHHYKEVYEFIQNDCKASKHQKIILSEIKKKMLADYGKEL